MPNPLYPPGFHGETAPEATYVWSRNPRSVQEMDYNKYLYFFSDDGKLSNHLADAAELRKLIGAPHMEWPEKMDKLMMADESGNIFPAHLPYIGDVTWLPEVQDAIRRLEGSDTVAYDGITPLIPCLLKDKIDPKPVIPKCGPIFKLTLKPYTLEAGHFTDAFHILQVRAKMTNISFMVFRDRILKNEETSRYHITRVTPEYEAGNTLLAKGSSVILWNARQITRKSFYSDFAWAIRVHKPILMILTEVRVRKISCTRVMEKLSPAMSWRLEPGKGVVGGTLIIWDPTKVNAEVIVAEGREIILRAMGCIKPRGANNVSGVGSSSSGGV